MQHFFIYKRKYSQSTNTKYNELLGIVSNDNLTKETVHSLEMIVKFAYHQNFPGGELNSILVPCINERSLAPKYTSSNPIPMLYARIRSESRLLPSLLPAIISPNSTTLFIWLNFPNPSMCGISSATIRSKTSSQF